MANVDELRARPDRVEERIEVVGVVAERNFLRNRAELDRVEDVARKRRPAADDLVPRVEGRLGEKVDHAVGAGADDDLVEGNAVPLGELRPERPDAAVRVAVQVVRDALDRLERRLERRKRPFVRRELDDPLEPELALHLFDRLAWLVGNELGDRAAKGSLPHAVSLRLWRQKKTAPPSAASAPARTPPLRALGTASCAFFFATRLPALTASQPTTAFRLFTMPMDLPLVGSRLSQTWVAERRVPLRSPRAAWLRRDRDEGTSYRGDAATPENLQTT